ncbi:MAG: endonuclease domain-containing protein [Galactobacter sp.]
MELDLLLLALGGVATGLTLQGFGFTRHQLAAWAVENPRRRLRRGVYCAPDADPDLRAAATHGGMLTCVSLLKSKGVWLLHEPTGPHVWLGGKGKKHPHPGCACREHWHPGKAGVGPVSVEIALIHMSRCATALAFFIALESAWNKKLIGAAARDRIRRAVPLPLRSLVEFAVGSSESGLESILRYRTRPLGWSLIAQPRLRLGRVDFIINGRVIVEVDGWRFHSSQTDFARDRVRQAEASIQGLETLNFSYQQVLNDWDSVEASIRAALIRADG